MIQALRLSKNGGERKTPAEKGMKPSIFVRNKFTGPLDRRWKFARPFKDLLFHFPALMECQSLTRVRVGYNWVNKWHILTSCHARTVKQRASTETVSRRPGRRQKKNTFQYSTNVMATSTPSQTLLPTTLGFGPIGNTALNRTLVTITSVFSLFGAVVIIVTYVTWKDIRTTSRKILVYISIADCVVVGSYLFGTFMPPNTDSVACITQSFLSTTANLWSFFWTTFLAIFLYTTIARQKPHAAEKMFWAFHVIGWGVPLVIVGMALKEDVLGNDRDIYSSGWCWIRVQNHGKNVQKNVMWMLITGKAWEVLVFVLVLIFYGLLKCHIRQEVNNGLLFVYMSYVPG